LERGNVSAGPPLKFSNWVAILGATLHFALAATAASFRGLGDLPGGEFASWASAISAILAWETNSSGFLLERADSLSPSNGWSIVAEPIAG